MTGNSGGTPHHRPAMPVEIVHLMFSQPTHCYLDCTLGDGGYAALILESAGPDAHLFGIDRDGEAIKRAGIRLAWSGDRFRAVRMRYEDILSIDGDVRGVSPAGIGGAIFDLGVSSLQLDDGKRGFSFARPGKLDMRMDPDSGGLTAADVVNGYDEKRLEKILFEYGEERFAKRIVRAIAAERSVAPITDTGHLAEIVRRAVPAGKPRAGKRTHPATRTFQAIRIEVNGELERLGDAIRAVVSMLAPGGVIAVVSYHSLEDRIVKRTFRELEKGCTCPPRIPKCVCGKKPVVEMENRRGIKPSEAECDENPRVRSAVLRYARRVAA